MAERTKFETFAGFAIRAGKLIRGANAIESTRKRIYSLWLCESASGNTKKQAEHLAASRGVPLYESRGLVLADLVHKENCKLVAFADKSLSEVAEATAGEHFLKLRNAIGGV